MAHDVFISHASENKATALAAVARLEAAGVRCWIAPRDIQPGEAWPRAINLAIRNAKVFVLIFSGAANESHHVSREVNLALEAGCAIVPVRIADVAPGDSLSYALAGVHWLDALTEPLDEHLAGMVRDVQALVDEQASISRAAETPIASGRPRTRDPLPDGGTRTVAGAEPLPDATGSLTPVSSHEGAGPKRDPLVTKLRQRTKREGKSATIALLLAITLGWLGAHRFYLGKPGTAVVQAATFGGLLIWVLADIFLIISGRMTDGQGRPLVAEGVIWTVLSSVLGALSGLMTLIVGLPGLAYTFGILGTEVDLSVGPVSLLIAAVLALPMLAHILAALDGRRAKRKAAPDGDGTAANEPLVDTTPRAISPEQVAA